MTHSIPHKYGVIALSEEEKEKLRKAWLNGSTQAVFPSNRMDDLRGYVKKLEDLYQILETSDDITEDNPAFSMMCKFTEDFYLVLEDIKSIVYDDCSRIYKWRKENLSSLYGSTSGSTQGSI